MRDPDLRVLDNCSGFRIRAQERTVVKVCKIQKAGGIRLQVFKAIFKRVIAVVAL